MKTMTYFDFLDSVNDSTFDELNEKLTTFEVDLRYGWKDANICLYNHIRNCYNVEIPELLTMGSNVK